jgi:plastocyanin
MRNAWLLGLFLLGSAFAAEATAAEAGTVTGRVRYQADPARPWSLGRYYINGGVLAEAVVALEGAGLPAGPAVEPKTVWMDQKDFQFVPETLVLRAGDSVRFTNSDEALHNVLSYQGASPFNVNLPHGKEHVQPFPSGKGLEQPIQLSCVFHGAMRGWVFVFPHPYYAITAKDGKFRFENVPAGEYRLHVMHPAGELELARTVTVKPGEAVEIDLSVGPDQKKK